jgi:regulatory protein
MNDEAAVESVITKIEQQKGNKRRYNVYVNDDYAFAVHEDILIKHRLLKGVFVTNEQMAVVLKDEEQNDAYLKAVRFLGFRPRTRKEVRQRLQQEGYEEGLIDETLQRLANERYLDDKEFAKMWTEHRIHSQKKGKALIRQELLQRGVDREHVQEALQHIDREEELQSAVEIGAKKWRQTSGETFDRKRKTAAFLMRRGYSGEVVQQALRIIIDIND